MTTTTTTETLDDQRAALRAIIETNGLREAHRAERQRLAERVAEHRAERRASGWVGVDAEPLDDDRGVIERAATSGASERARQRVGAARDADAWKRANAYPISGDTLLTRCASAVEWVAARANATDDERDEMLSALTLGFLRARTIGGEERRPLRPGKGGRLVPSDPMPGRRAETRPLTSADASARLLRRRAWGRLLDARKLADRRAARESERLDARAESAAAESDSDAGSVWAAALGPRLTRSLMGDRLAASVGADALAERLGVTDAERAAVESALGGYGSARDAAAAWGISEQTARKRLSRGRAALVERYPTADALADALADAQRLGDDDAERVCLSAVERDALVLVESVWHRSARLARVAGCGQGGDSIGGPQRTGSARRVLAWVERAERLPAWVAASAQPVGYGPSARPERRPISAATTERRNAAARAAARGKVTLSG